MVSDPIVVPLELPSLNDGPLASLLSLKTDMLAVLSTSSTSNLGYAPPYALEVVGPRRTFCDESIRMASVILPAVPVAITKPVAELPPSSTALIAAAMPFVVTAKAIFLP
jgi:hypothetical protein